VGRGRGRQGAGSRPETEDRDPDRPRYGRPGREHSRNRRGRGASASWKARCPARRRPSNSSPTSSRGPSATTTPGPARSKARSGPRSRCSPRGRRRADRGIDRVELLENDDGTEFVNVYYAGPIRSAGRDRAGAVRARRRLRPIVARHRRVQAARRRGRALRRGDLVVRQGDRPPVLAEGQGVEVHRTAHARHARRGSDGRRGGLRVPRSGTRRHQLRARRDVSRGRRRDRAEGPRRSSGTPATSTRSTGRGCKI